MSAAEMLDEFLGKCPRCLAQGCGCWPAQDLGDVSASSSELGGVLVCDIQKVDPEVPGGHQSQQLTASR